MEYQPSKVLGKEMKVFNEINSEGNRCPICGTYEIKPVVLIAIEGTADGNNVEAMQVHLDCLQPVIVTSEGGSKAIVQFI